MAIKLNAAYSKKAGLPADPMSPPFIFLVTCRTLSAS
jgi:hypothetical protein